MAAASLDPSASDAASAVRNAFTLGLSLVATWSVALLVRLFLPRHLGPELFGTYTFADSFAATFIVAVDLGLDMYIRKEIPVRPEHASDFFGSLVAVRMALTAVLLAGMAVFLELTGRQGHVQLLVLLFGVAQLVSAMSGSLAALLQAAGTVKGLAAMNVTAKLLWGAGVVLVLAARLELPALAAAFLVAEAVRGVVLLVLARRHLHLRLTWNGAAAKAVVLASLPFYLNNVAYTAFGRLDVSMLSMITSDVEAGWYGAASNFSALAMLISPLIGWVLLPLFARAAARSTEELFSLVRRSLYGTLMLATPISLFLSVGADVWIGVMFGEAFAPAALILRVHAPMFVLTYLAMILATCLIRLERAWTVTAISSASLVALPVLNWLLIPRARLWLGPGGAGVGAAVALMLCEIGVTIAFAVAVDRRAFTPVSWSKVVKVIATCLSVVAIDLALRPLGPARLAVDALAYGALLAGLGVVSARDVSSLMTLVRERRREGRA
jgi:O-antigen/teichoic acid export membrane protein